MVNWKNTIRLICSIAIISACNNSDSKKNKEIESSAENDGAFSSLVNKREIQGYTQGSTFVVKTSDDSLLTSTYELESLFTGFDAELSGYMNESLISKVNESKDGVNLPNNTYFSNCFQRSMEIFDLTNGAFDPSVFPLVKAWGFFKDSTLMLTQHQVDSCLQFISFENGKNFIFSKDSLVKKDKRFEFDFNAIAQGLSVDVVAKYLDNKGQKNYFIEIGGEVYAKGINPEGNAWVVGIDNPEESNTGMGNRSLENTVSLKNKALATSGNYRKFYVMDGRKFSHTIDPKTGYSVKHNLLSATVLANDCASADAFATSFMVMGKDSTLNFITHHPELELEVYLLFENEEGRIERAYTSGMTTLIQQ